MEAQKRERGAAISSLPDSQIAQGQTLSPPVSARSTQQDSSVEAPTVLSIELFDDRAEALRATVAKAKVKGRSPARDATPF